MSPDDRQPGIPVSYHLFRRTARARERRLQHRADHQYLKPEAGGGDRYRVFPSQRGPYRWVVRRISLDEGWA